MSAHLGFQPHKSSRQLQHEEDLDEVQIAMHDVDPDSEDELIALNDVRRGLMEQRSKAKNSFLASGGDPTAGYGRVRSRLMMPTDLDKWSRDQRRAESLASSMVQADMDRSADIREFVAFGGANAHRARFTHANRRTQDQAIAGNDNTLSLLLSLQRPLAETSSMQLAFSALQQHVNESDQLLEATLKAHQSHSMHDSVLPTGVPTPSREEFNLLWTPNEASQLHSDAANVPDHISGFNLTGESWSQGPHVPNFDATIQSVAVVLPSSGMPGPIVPPLQAPVALPNAYMADDLHESVSTSNKIPMSGYYSAED